MITSCPLLSIERFRIRCNPRGTCHAGYHASSFMLRWGAVKATTRWVTSVDPLQCMNGYTLGFHITHEPTFCCTQHLIACPLTAKISSPIHRASSRTSSNELQDLSSESQSRPSRVVWIDEEVIPGRGFRCSSLLLSEPTWGGYNLPIPNDGGYCYCWGLSSTPSHFITFSHIISSLSFFTIPKQWKACICWFGPSNGKYAFF